MGIVKRLVDALGRKMGKGNKDDKHRSSTTREELTQPSANRPPTHRDQRQRVPSNHVARMEAMLEERKRARQAAELAAQKIEQGHHQDEQVAREDAVDGEDQGSINAAANIIIAPTPQSAKVPRLLSTMHSMTEESYTGGAGVTNKTDVTNFASSLSRYSPPMKRKTTDDSLIENRAQIETSAMGRRVVRDGDLKRRRRQAIYVEPGRTPLYQHDPTTKVKKESPLPAYRSRAIARTLDILQSTSANKDGIKQVSFEVRTDLVPPRMSSLQALQKTGASGRTVKTNKGKAREVVTFGESSDESASSGEISRKFIASDTPETDPADFSSSGLSHTQQSAEEDRLMRELDQMRQERDEAIRVGAHFLYAVQESRCAHDVTQAELFAMRAQLKRAKGDAQFYHILSRRTMDKKIALERRLTFLEGRIPIGYGVHKHMNWQEKMVNRLRGLREQKQAPIERELME